MSAENKGLVRRLFQEVWNRGKLAAAEEILASTYVSHGDAPDVLSVGVLAFQRRVSGVLSRFADFEVTLQDLIAEEDKVVARWSTYATDKRDRLDIASASRILRIAEIGIFRVDAGRIIAESWVSSSQSVDGLLHQTDKAVSRVLDSSSAEELISFPPS